MPQKYPKEFLELCKSVTAKRPKTVINHILKHGHITTEELKEKMVTIIHRELFEMSGSMESRLKLFF